MRRETGGRDGAEAGRVGRGEVEHDNILCDLQENILLHEGKLQNLQKQDISLNMTGLNQRLCSIVYVIAPHQVSASGDGFLRGRG